jgi:DNA polymerase III subunit delta
MVRIFAGENSFGLQKELQLQVEAFLNEVGDLGLERIDCEDVDIDRIQEALTSLPFLASKKLVVLRNPSKNKLFVERVEQLLNDLPETTDVIITETKLDKRSVYYKYLKTKTDFKEFNELDQNGLAQWLVSEAKSREGSLSAGDARYLVERVGANQQLLSSELEKLLIYSSKIDRSTINLLTDQAPQSTIFELLEAAFAGNAKQALNLYAEQRALKVEPPQIIALISWQLHILAIIKTAGERSAEQIAQDAKLNPYVVRKSQAIAKKISFSELKKLIGHLLDIDLKSKRTNLDVDAALQHFILVLGS